MAQYLASTRYLCNDGPCSDRDNVVMDAVGRDADECGWGCGERDLGWICRSKAAAEKVKLVLENIGMSADVARLP